MFPQTHAAVLQSAHDQGPGRSTRPEVRVAPTTRSSLVPNSAIVSSGLGGGAFGRNYLAPRAIENESVWNGQSRTASTRRPPCEGMPVSGQSSQDSS